MALVPCNICGHDCRSSKKGGYCSPECRAEGWKRISNESNAKSRKRRKLALLIQINKRILLTDKHSNNGSAKLSLRA